MKFIPKVLIALALTQAEGFSASRLTVLEPALMNGVRRATSLLSPSVARYSTSILRSDILGRFSSQLPSSLLRNSARLFSFIRIIAENFSALNYTMLYWQLSDFQHPHHLPSPSSISILSLTCCCFSFPSSCSCFFSSSSCLAAL